MAAFDPSKSASVNYLRGLQAARKAVMSNKTDKPGAIVHGLVQAHLERDRSKDSAKKVTPKKASPKKPGK